MKERNKILWKEDADFMSKLKFEKIDTIQNESKTLDDNMKVLRNIRSQHIVDINMVRIFLTLWLAAAILAIIPGSITFLLVFPIPNYHNVRTVIKNAWIFYTTRQRYIWKGWCLDHGEGSKK